MVKSSLRAELTNNLKFHLKKQLQRMSKKTDDDTKTILKNLLILLFCWYSLYYLLSVLLVGTLGKSQWDFLKTLPFQHVFHGVGVGDIALGSASACTPHILASWLALVIILFINIWLIYFIVQSTKNAWDYAITVSFIHWAITCAG
jgi:hypothetical protein